LRRFWLLTEKSGDSSTPAVSSENRSQFLESVEELAFFRADPVIRGNGERSIQLERRGSALYKLLVMRKRVQDRCNFVAAPRSIAPYDDALDLQEGPLLGLELLNRLLAPLEGMNLEFPEYEFKTRGAV
jgi:hypothetical protein